MSVSAILSGTVQIVDSTSGASPLTIPISFTVSGTAVADAMSLTIGTSPTSVTLPIGTVNFVMIINKSNSATLTVTWTPNGGSSNVVQTLEPGSGIVVAQAASGAGITALSLEASGSGTPAQVILLG